MLLFRRLPHLFYGLFVLAILNKKKRESRKEDDADGGCNPYADLCACS